MNASRNRFVGGFTLVEIMIVVAIIALLSAIALPGFLRARKRSQAVTILTDLRLIQSAVDQYALETTRTAGFEVTYDMWKDYMKVGSRLYNTGADPFSQPYGSVLVDDQPTVPANTWDRLSDVLEPDFWSPFPKGS